MGAFLSMSVFAYHLSRIESSAFTEELYLAIFFSVPWNSIQAVMLDVKMVTSATQLENTH